MYKLISLNIMKIISLVLIISSTFSSVSYASMTPKISPIVSYSEAPAFALTDDVVGGGEDGIEGFISWIVDTLFSFVGGIFLPCHEVPDFTSFQSGSKILDLTTPGKWVSTGDSMTSGKAMKINWTTQGSSAKARKYMVIYRIDPRFARPQTFIVKYNYNTGNYDSDFHQYLGGKLVANQLDANPQGQAFTGSIKNNNDYFNFVNRSPISVSAGEVVNISLIGMSDFLNAVGASGFTGELSNVGTNATAIYTSTGGLQDNKIIYLDAWTWCGGGYASDGLPYQCLNISPGVPQPIGNPDQYTYNNTSASKSRLFGKLDLKSNRLITLPSCADNATGKNFQTPSYSAGYAGSYNYAPCLYDHGRTMAISVGGNVVKSPYTPFTHSNSSGADFFYYQGGTGTLDFVDTTNAIPINGMFANQLMSSWTWTNSSDVMANIDTTTKVLYAGRYIMDIVIGNGNVGDFDQQNDISVEYQIMPDDAKGKPQIPAVNSVGTNVPQTYTANANTTGILWLKVNNPNIEVIGNISVAYTSYHGDTFLSDILYNGVVHPVQNAIFNTSKLFYSALITNPTLQWIIRLLLTFYIMLNALKFLSGMKEVTMSSLLEDVVRIAIIIALLTPTSWDFFYNNVFRIFLEGMNYLFSNVIGLTSNVNNPFGFVDVMFRKYTDSELWVLLLAEFISFTNGLTIVAIATTVAILSFLVVVLEVVISYVFAYVVIAVLISLAPLFIICMLFERTRGIFDNWISLMFNYMIQPTILLIFFLLLDQLMTNQLNQVLTKACWGWLIGFTFSIPLDWMDINYSIPLGIGIPGLIPVVSGNVVPGAGTQSAGTLMGILLSCFMFYIYSKIASGMNGYVTQIVSAITNVQGGSAGSRTGAISKQVQSGASKVGKIATAPVRFVGRELKEKIWDGKLSTGPKLRGGAKEEAAPLNKRVGVTKPPVEKGDGSK